jgi:hypothetical protein
VHDRDLGLRFLDAVLAEGRQAGLDGVGDTLRRHRLRDGDERDVGGIAADACAGVGDAIEDPGAGRPETVYFRRRNEGISRSSASYAAARLTGTGSLMLR